MNKKMWNKRKLTQEQAEEPAILDKLNSDELLLWQVWQLHAKLRQRLIPLDPQAVIMIDNLVTNFYLVSWIKLDAAMTSEELIEQIARAQHALGKALPDWEARALMLAQVPVRVSVGA